MEELIDGFTAAGRFGYEETAYLLMFGGLPTAEELEQFKNILSFFREQPPVGCLLYTSDAADDLIGVDLGGLRCIKKNNQVK